MASVFKPKLSILPKSQRRLWPELSRVPEFFVLCRGTAIALQLAHRASLDFDFIGDREFDPDDLYSLISFLDQSHSVQKGPSTLKCIVDRGGPVQLSFFGAPRIKLTNPPLVAGDNKLQVASLIDLAGMKSAVVQKRSEAKDYIDLDAIIESGAIDLATALSAARAIYGQTFNPELTLKSLTYFGDGDLDKLPEDIRERLVAAVRAIQSNEPPT
jgi:hypothetical protein